MKCPQGVAAWRFGLAGLLLAAAGIGGYLLYSFYGPETLKQRAYRASIAGLEDNLRKFGDSWPPEMRSTVEQALRLLHEKKLPPYPLPVWAVLCRHLTTGEWQLNIAYLDRDCTIEGVRIEEVDGETGVAITEDYPWLHHLSDEARQTGFMQVPYHDFTLPVKLRIKAADRKDETQWNQWVQAPQEGEWPPIWIGTPGPKRKVEIALYGRDGAVSEAFPVRLVIRDPKPETVTEGHENKPK